jgi:hypothetical protein
LLALLFCALLLRTFIPAGYMVGSAASGSPALILCPDAAPPPAMHGSGHEHPPSQHREHPCPFGALAAPALPPAPLALAAVAPPVAPLPAPNASAALSPTLAAPPPPSTGPPVSA